MDLQNWGREGSRREKKGERRKERKRKQQREKNNFSVFYFVLLLDICTHKQFLRIFASSLLLFPQRHFN